MEAGDYEIALAESGAQALPHIDQKKFDLALLDIQLPDANGLSLARRLRKKDSQVVIIMLSALDETDLIAQAARAGAKAYIVKPFELIDVLEIINSIDGTEKLIILK